MMLLQKKGRGEKGGFTPSERQTRIPRLCSHFFQWRQKPAPGETAARGFTLVEVVVVAAIFGILGTTLVASFSTGMSVWKRAAGLTYSYRQTIVGLERLAMELRRVMNYPPVGFFGTGTDCYFANIASDGVKNVSYRYDGHDGALFRLSRNLSAGEEDAPERKVIAAIGNFTMAYYGFNSETGSFGFLPQWNSTAHGLPMAVKVSFASADGGRTFEKVIIVPAAQ